MKKNVLIFVLLFPCWLFAQFTSVTVSEPLNIRNDYGYEIIGELRGRTLLFRDKYDEFEVYGYDRQMNELFHKELEFEKRGLSILGMVAGKNDFSIIYAQQRRGKNTLHINKYDAGATLIDTLTIKDYGDRPFRQPKLEIVQSENHNCIGIYNTTDRDKLEILCFQVDKMKVLWDRSIVLEEQFYESNHRALVLGNQGEFAVIAEFNNRRNRIEQHYFKVFSIIGAVEKISNVHLPDMLTVDAFYAFDNENRRFACAGLFSDKNLDKVHGCYFWTSGQQKDSIQVFADSFDERFVSQVRGKNIENEKKGVEDAEIVEMIFRKDGGIVLLCERQEEVGRGISSGRGFFRDAPRMIMDYYYDDIFSITFEGNGRAHWKTVLQKKQYSQDDEAIFSSFFVMRAPSSLHLLYNDEIRFENTCSEYILFPDGSFRRRSLMNTTDRKLRLRFRDALQVGPRVVVVPSEYRSKLSLVRVEY